MGPAAGRAGTPQQRDGARDGQRVTRHLRDHTGLLRSLQAKPVSQLWEAILHGRDGPAEVLPSREAAPLGCNCFSKTHITN